MAQQSEFIIEGIDAIRRRGSIGECFIVSAYLVTKFWSETLSKGVFRDDYDKVRRACDPLMNDELGIPPRKVDDVVRLIQEVALPNNTITFKVAHLQDLTLKDLEGFVRQRQPPIPIYDMHFLQFQDPSSIMHCSVMVGYNAHSIIVNDDQYGYRYSLQRDRFTPSWENRLFRRKAILIRPEEPTYKIDTMLEEVVKQKNVIGH
jgi:hypothetical protein